MRSRASATTPNAASNHDRPRQPFRPLQPFRTSRSLTPLTPTLPDKVVDTPPREVILTPRATPKPMKRKVASRSKRTTTNVKSEPPEIDLSKVRPPSPSDDPLLLSGTPATRSPPLRARFTPAFSSSPSDSMRVAPPVSFTARLSGVRVCESSPDTEVHALPVFNVPRTVAETSGVWSDSDDDGFNLTGEYTGNYKIFKVPTKADPARKRMDSWGRPVSPFPYSEMMERSLPLSEGGGRHGDIDILDVIPGEEHLWEVATEPPPSDIEPSSPQSVSEDEFAYLDNDFPLFDVDAESTQVRPLIQSREALPESDQTVEEEEEEAQIDRELSVAVDDGPGVDGAAQPIRVDNPMDDDSSDEDDDVKGEDIVKITSDDPKRAARAAAILRMHDYDCILAAEKKKRSSRSTRKRRKTIENAGISKSCVESRSRRWQTLQGCGTSPGSRSLPLLELWREAEDSVFLEHNSISYCDASFMLSPLKATTTCPPPPEPLIPPLSGEWTRDCWKCLDKCLVAERLAVAATLDLETDVLADMEDVSKDAVLDRFATQLGGGSVLVGLGSDWSRDNLMLRLDVLIRKQSRTARRAPPIARKDSHDTTELCYRGLLQEAMTLSGTLARCPTGSSVSSGRTVVSERYDVSKAVLGDLSSDLEPSWLTSHTGPIRTPSRMPDSRSLHSKDQVYLRHAPLPQKSMIPVPIRPKRLVDLRHHSPMKTDRGGWRSTARRSSGASVKELVKQFESLDQ